MIKLISLNNLHLHSYLTKIQKILNLISKHQVQLNKKHQENQLAILFYNNHQKLIKNKLIHIFQIILVQVKLNINQIYIKLKDLMNFLNNNRILHLCLIYQWHHLRIHYFNNNLKINQCFNINHNNNQQFHFNKIQCLLKILQ